MISFTPSTNVQRRLRRLTGTAGTVLLATALAAGCSGSDTATVTAAPIATVPSTSSATTVAVAPPTPAATTLAPATAAPTTAVPATAAPTTPETPATAAPTTSIDPATLFTIPVMAEAPLIDDAVDWVAENGKAEMKISPDWTPTGNAPTTEGAASLEGEWTFGVGPDDDPAVVRVSTYDAGDATIENFGDTFWSTRIVDAGMVTSAPIMGPNGQVISFFESVGGQYHWNGFVSIANGTLAVGEVRFLDEDFDAVDQVGPLMYTIQAK